MSKTLHVSQIEQGLKKVRRLGHLEDTFDIIGRSITLRTVLRRELEAANQVCQPLFDLSQESEDSFSFSNWIQAMKIETLTYAVMELDSIDFHGVDYITTDKIDDQTGHPIKVQKHVFVRGIVSEWEDSVIDTVFKKFNELTERAQEKALEGVEFAKNDPEVRIEELEQELRELRAKVQKNKAPSSDIEEEDSSVNKEVLKKQMFSEVDEDSQPPHVSEDFMYENAPQREPARKETPPQNHPERVEHPANTGEEPLYYNEHGEPLAGDELAAAEAQDRLLMQRQGRHNTQAQDQQHEGRQPLNQVDAQVLGGHDGPQNTVNANKRKNDTGDMKVDPSLSDDVEVLTPRKPIERGNPKINEGPDPNVNPNFRPPNKRNK